MRSLLVVGLVCLSLAAGAGVATASHSDMYVTVSDVTVSDDEPTTGDTITVTPTISHSAERSGGFHVTEVVLVLPGEGVVSRADNLGAIASGESLDVPLQVTLDEAGEKRLLIKVRGGAEDADGHLQQIGYVERPVYVSVSEPAAPEPKPRVRIDAESAVEGTETPVTVTISNGGDDDLSNLFLRLDSVDGSVAASSRIRPTLGAGNMTTFTFRVRPSDPGEATLKATLRYGEDGDQTVEAFRPVQVAALRNDVDVYASLLEHNESTKLQYRITNRGNAEIEDVAISGRMGETRLPGATVASVDASSSKTVTIPVGDAMTGRATLDATYTMEGITGRERVERTVSLNGAATADGDAGQSTAAFVAGDGTLPLSVGVAFVGLLGVAFGYRQWGR